MVDGDYTCGLAVVAIQRSEQHGTNRQDVLAIFKPKMDWIMPSM